MSATFWSYFVAAMVFLGQAATIKARFMAARVILGWLATFGDCFVAAHREEEAGLSRKLLWVRALTKLGTAFWRHPNPV